MKRTFKFTLLACLLLLASVFMFISCNKRNSCKHDDPLHIESIGAVAPTCQQTGLTEGMKCNLCKTMVLPQRIVEKISCRESDWIIDKEATQTENGLKHTECTMCGNRMKEEHIIAGTSIGLSYLVNSDNKSCAILGIGDCLDSDVVLPTVIDGYRVTSIWKNAFYGSKTLTSINISNSVTIIGDAAFAHCYVLTNIVIPDSVTTIGDLAISDCDSLISITIPDSVTTIGDYVFSSCENITRITIGKNVRHIGKMVFSSCESLEAIIFNGTVEQWEAIEKGSNWNIATGSYTIYCTDGEIAKDGTVTYY